MRAVHGKHRVMEWSEEKASLKNSKQNEKTFFLVFISPALAPNIVAHKFLVMDPSESAHFVPYIPPPPPPEGICSSASVSWVTFYPCPSKLCSLSALSCLHSGSRSAGILYVQWVQKWPLELVPSFSTCTSYDYFLWWFERAVKTLDSLCTQARCALVAQIAGLNIYLSDMVDR